MDELDKKDLLKRIRAQIAKSEYESAFSALSVADPEDDLALQLKYSSLLRKIPTVVLGLIPVRIAIVTSSTINYFSEILRFWLARIGLQAEIFESEYDTIHQTILNSSSGLYDFKPDITIVFSNYRDVRCRVPSGSSRERVEQGVSSAVSEFVSLWEVLRERCGCHILQNNADIPDWRVFGNYEGSVIWGALNVLRRFNVEIAEKSGKGVTILDMDYISSLYGKSKWHDARYWHHSKHAFAPDATGLAAHQAAVVIGAVKGLAKKCLVLDLDNTLWGGVVADDGLEGIILGSGVSGEAYVAFQKYVLSLKERGVVLAVCSKNDEDKAKEPFLKHPDMEIGLGDIAVFKANWRNKADNLREIAAVLNLGLDSIVFVDDNPAERELVRSLLPMVSVPDLGEDPAEYVSALSRTGLFETVSFSREDLARSEYYRSNARRVEFRGTFSDLSEYLQSLDMVASIGQPDGFHLPRIVQLINKSNQFHLTTTRYSEGQIRAMLEEPGKHCRFFALSDKFGDNGLVSVVILEEQPGKGLLVDTWVMSCRVMSRGMEEFVCQEIVRLAQVLERKVIVGKYIPSPKNQLVAKLYERLQFELVAQDRNGTSLWALDLERAIPNYMSFIRKSEIEATELKVAN